MILMPPPKVPVPVIGVEVNRLALNMDQVEELSPPENPAKITDSRASSYISRFGNSSWELDAIEPSMLAEIVRSNIWTKIDEELWEESHRQEEEMRNELLKFAKDYR